MSRDGFNVFEMIRDRVDPLDPRYADGVAASARSFAEAIQETRLGEDVADVVLRALTERPSGPYDPATDAMFAYALLSGRHRQ